MWNTINWAGFGLPRLPQMKSAVALAAWFATLMISHSLIMGAYGWAMNTIQSWKLKKQLEAMLAKQAQVAEPTEEEVEANA